MESVKLDIIQWIANIQDEKLLQTLASLKQAAQDKDWWDSLTPAQIKSIQEGIKNLNEGEFIDDKKFWSRYGKRA